MTANHLTAKPPRVLTLGTLTDLVELVPRLLGFRPAESVVVVVVDDARVRVTARVDLPDEHAAELVANLEQLWRRFPAATYAVLAYTAERERAWANLFAVDAHLPDIDRTLIHVDAERYYFEPCDPGHSYDAESGVMAARASAAGMSVLASREELGKLLDPDRTPADVSASLDRVSARASSWPDLVAEAASLVEKAECGSDLDLDAATTLCLASHDPKFLDAVLLTTASGNAEARRDLWSRVVRSSVPRCTGFALVALGLAAWLCGQGALQVVCLQRMVGQQTDEYWAGVLERINADAVPPAEWDLLRAQLLRDESPDREP